MTDTPDHIKKIQLEIWLSKSPAERIKQFLDDNEMLYRFWDNAKKEKGFSVTTNTIQKQN